MEYTRTIITIANQSFRSSVQATGLDNRAGQQGWIVLDRLWHWSEQENSSACQPYRLDKTVALHNLVCAANQADNLEKVLVALFPEAPKDSHLKASHVCTIAPYSQWQ